MQIGESDENFPPRYNGFKCMNCNQVTLVVELARGITPMFMTCFRTKDCGGTAINMGHSPDIQLLGNVLLVEWVKPTEADLERIKHPELLAYLNRGGLIRRATETAPDWVKRLV